MTFVEWEMVYEGKILWHIKIERSIGIWKEEKVPLLDIDVQGAVHVQQQHREQCSFYFY